MSLAAPKVNPGAQAAPPASMGATDLTLGGGQDATLARTQGAVGRLALRVGKPASSTPQA